LLGKLHKYLGNFFHRRSSVLISRKWVGQHFGQFFSEIIWSLCCKNKQREGEPRWQEGKKRRRQKEWELLVSWQFTSDAGWPDWDKRIFAQFWLIGRLLWGSFYENYKSSARLWLLFNLVKVKRQCSPKNTLGNFRGVSDPLCLSSSWALHFCRIILFGSNTLLIRMASIS
jgi:hypothetical protein